MSLQPPWGSTTTFNYLVQNGLVTPPPREAAPHRKQFQQPPSHGSPCLTGLRIQRTRQNSGQRFAQPPRRCPPCRCCPAYHSPPCQAHLRDPKIPPRRNSSGRGAQVAAGRVAPGTLRPVAAHSTASRVGPDLQDDTAVAGAGPTGRSMPLTALKPPPTCAEQLSRCLHALIVGELDALNEAEFHSYVSAQAGDGSVGAGKTRTYHRCWPAVLGCVRACPPPQPGAGRVHDTACRMRPTVRRRTRG